MKLIEEAKQLYIGENQLEVDLKRDVFALDSSTIDLCLDVFCWATFRSTKAGIKIHTLLNSKTAIPEFIFIFSSCLCLYSCRRNGFTNNTYCLCRSSSKSFTLGPKHFGFEIQEKDVAQRNVCLGRFKEIKSLPLLL